ncbi:DUF4350 domain-containing protein [Brachybacterium huguangmaarense]
MSAAFAPSAPRNATPGAGPGRGRVIAIVVLAVALAIAAAILRGSYRDAPFEPTSPGAAGSRALVRVLEDGGGRGGGARVSTVRSTDEAASALREGATLVLTSPQPLDDPQLLALREALDAGDGRLVLVAPDDDALAVLAPGIVTAAEIEDPDARLSASGACGAASFGARTVAPGGAPLDDDSADRLPGRLYTAPAGWDACFARDGASSVLTDGRVTILGSGRYVMNDGVGDEDDPAVALNAIGGTDSAEASARPEIAWYLPSAADPMLAAQVSPLGLLPDWLGPLLLWLGATTVLALVAAAWRAGPVVVEPLPVTVRADELTAARARLLHRSGARDTAAASLRSACAVTIARRLGVRPTASLHDLLAALAPRVAYPPRAAALLTPAPVRSDAELVALADALDHLIEEIDR